MDELTPWWTVVGVWPKTRERWMGNYQAVTARTAEDIARMDVREGWEAAGMRGPAEFWVCGVFEGRHAAADVYAKFTDPDTISEDDL
jgi:hypothetical protein